MKIYVRYDLTIYKQRPNNHGKSKSGFAIVIKGLKGVEEVGVDIDVDVLFSLITMKS